MSEILSSKRGPLGLPSIGQLGVAKDGVQIIDTIRRALARVRRRAYAFGVTHVVEGVLMRRQAEKFYLIMSGHIYFETLSAAVELDLFGLLKQHRCLTCAGHAPPRNS